MSMFSYISFPRQVDTSCLQSKFDKSKAFTVAEIRGTELEKQFNGNVNDLPDNMSIYLGDFFTDFQGITIFDKHEASFADVFTNEFVYGFQGTFELLDADRYTEECMRYFHDDDIDNGEMSETDYRNYIYKIINYNREDVSICRDQLYKLIKANTYQNEVIELYSEFVDHINFNLGPARENVELYSSEVLASELLRMDDKLKIVIRHAS